jgi:hypothetical protein
MKLSRLSCVIPLLVAVWALAAEPHVHGVARLDVAVEGPRLTLMLESPLDHLVGFERAPKSDKERSAVRNMAERFHHSATLFAPTPEARCELGTVKLASPVIEPSLLAAALAQGEPPRHQHAKDQGHVPEKGNGKTQAHGGGNHAADGHAELAAEIAFTCAKPEALEGMEVKLFDAFPHLKRLMVQAVTPRGQSAATLTPRARQLAW